MWQRFTERARRAIFFAQEEAGKQNINYVSTEHLLLGILRETDSAGAQVLELLGISILKVQKEIERQCGNGDRQPGEDMQLTPRAKRVIDLAYDEARQLNVTYIGTEHLLLGLIREGEGLAGRVLAKFGVELSEARRAVGLLQIKSITDEPPGSPTERKVVNEADNLQLSLLRQVRLALQMLRQTNPELFERTKLDIFSLTPFLAHMIQSEERQPGDFGVAKAEGRSHVEVAMDSETFLRLEAVFQAKDTHGYHAMMHGDQTMFLLPVGTKIKLLLPPPNQESGYAAGGLYVRVMEGEYEGYAGWLFSEDFERIGPDESPFPPKI
jgi:hypothetical protein